MWVRSSESLSRLVSGRSCSLSGQALSSWALSGLPAAWRPQGCLHDTAYTVTATSSAEPGGNHITFSLILDSVGYERAKTHPGIRRGHWTPSLDSGAGKILEEHLDQEVLLWASLGEKNKTNLPSPGLPSGHNNPHTSHMQNIPLVPRLSRSLILLQLQAQAQSQGPCPSHLPDTQPEQSRRAGFLKAYTKVGKPEAPCHDGWEIWPVGCCLCLYICSVFSEVPCSGLLLLLLSDPSFS